MIERTERGGIVTLRLAHKKASAMDIELLDAIIKSLDGAAHARAIVIAGTGNIFSAGVDLFRLLDSGRPYIDRFFPLLVEAFRKLFSIEVPVVAAVNGHAIAGGCLIALASDYRLMAAGKARIGVPELLVGVPLPSSPIEIVRFAVPRDRVQRVLYSGNTYVPEEALAMGLIDEIVEPGVLEERALDLAGRMATLPPQVFAITKRQLRHIAIERMAQTASMDGEVLEAWAAPETHAHIREYLARTVKK